MARPPASRARPRGSRGSSLLLGLAVAAAVAALALALASEAARAAKLGDPVDMSEVGIEFKGASQEEKDAKKRAFMEQFASSDGGEGLKDGEVDLGSILGGGGGGDGAGMDGGRRFSRDIEPVEADVPLVQCDACKNMVRRLVARVKAKRASFGAPAQAKPSSGVKRVPRFGEADIMDLMKLICDPQHEDGEWITEYDVQEADGRLKLVRQNSAGHCEEECKTVALACQNVVDQADVDLAELVYVNKTEDAEKLCAAAAPSLKGACGKPYPAMSKDRAPGGANFKVKSNQDLAMDKVNRDMRERQEVLGDRAFEL